MDMPKNTDEKDDLESYLESHIGPKGNIGLPGPD